MSLAQLPFDIFSHILKIAHEMENELVTRVQAAFQGRRVRFDMGATRSGFNRPRSAITEYLSTQKSRQTTGGLFG
eukprot:2841080-Prymnesium_polylepis.1